MAALYILILFAHVGPLGNGNSNAITTADFYSAETCRVAGEAAVKLAGGSTKNIVFACVKK